jgi:hypothetical protein
MGQYHHPVCIEAEEGLNPAGMDSGLKEGEQGFNRPSTPAALIALVCARGGNMPADCSVAADRPLGRQTSPDPRRLCRGR